MTTLISQQNIKNEEREKKRKDKKRKKEKYKHPSEEETKSLKGRMLDNLGFVWGMENWGIENI